MSMPSPRDPEEPDFHINDRRASSHKPVPTTPTTAAPPSSNQPQNNVLAAFSATAPVVVKRPTQQPGSASNSQLQLPAGITSLFPSGFSLHLIRGVPQVLSSRTEETLVGNWRVHKAAWLPAPGEQGFEFGFDTTLAFDRFANMPCILIAFKHEKSGGFVPVGVYGCENQSVQIETNPIRLMPLTRDPVPALKVGKSAAFWSILFPTSGLSGCATGLFFFFLLPYMISHFWLIYQMLVVQKKPIGIEAILAIAWGAFLVFFSLRLFNVKDAIKESKKGARPMTGDEAVKLVYTLGNFLQQQGILLQKAQAQPQQLGQNNSQNGRL